MAILIAFNSNNINSAVYNFGAFNGENQVFGWHSHYKQNNNYFPIGIAMSNPANLNFISDLDVVDTSINDQDANIGSSYQQT
ncbi:hypothetical protein JOD45_003053 [Scopulibacillus daqui]|uniref:Spore germination protein GerPA/GerPF n=1 Tax=Scopulibacillus daqui TaxID=1469162 RepID=A0ABS2Q551_9BACL|nr:hypothetical protein [Scopulibacillus daqui]MBM7646819.1 hypothetical protein [Scopulibacillus daqui]